MGILGQSGGRCEGERQDIGNARLKPSVNLRSILYLVLGKSAPMDFEHML